MKRGPKPKPLGDRFWSKVDKSGRCWVSESTVSMIKTGRNWSKAA